jgi:hypothetical protein
LPAAIFCACAFVFASGSGCGPISTDSAPDVFDWQQCLYFRPLPQGQDSLRPTLAVALTAAPVPLIDPDLFFPDQA